MSKKRAALLNMGPKSTEWLKEIGILTVEDIEREGVVPVYMRLKESRPGITRVMLWALQGAVLNLHWNTLPDEMKAELLQQLESE